MDPLGGEHFFVEVPMPGFQAWNHEQCPLYLARVKLTRQGRVLDELTFRFGMREIGVKDRRYKLNLRCDQAMEDRIDHGPHRARGFLM